MNKCAFTGRFTRDPETVTTNGGKTLAKFGLAVDRRFKDNKTGEWKSEASFLDMVVWEDKAKTIAERYRKGDFIVIVDCEVRQENWEKDGQKRSRLVFHVNQFEPIPGQVKQQRDRNGSTPEPVATADDPSNDGGDIPF